MIAETFACGYGFGCDVCICVLFIFVVVVVVFVVIIVMVGFVRISPEILRRTRDIIMYEATSIGISINVDYILVIIKFSLAFKMCNYL